jgi:chemotaxis protein MotB
MVAVIWTSMQASNYVPRVDSSIAPSGDAMRSLFRSSSTLLSHRLVVAIAIAAIGACAAPREELALRDRTIDELRVHLQKAEDAQRSETEKRIAANLEAATLRSAVDGECAALKDAKPTCDALAAESATTKAHRDEVRARLLRFREKFVTIGEAQGVAVTFRKNRLVLQLSADLVFDPGSVNLKKTGKDTLRVIGARIREDAAFAGRTFLVAGHTDNSPYPEELPYRDNWGLSLARARQVLLFLAGPAARPKDGPQPSELGGGVDAHQLAAIGYADTDPIAGTVDVQTRDEQQKNRRVEIVLDTASDEVLDLGALP